MPSMKVVSPDEKQAALLAALEQASKRSNFTIVGCRRNIIGIGFSHSRWYGIVNNRPDNS